MLLLLVPGNQGSRVRGREEQVLPGPNAASLLRDATEPEVALHGDGCPSLMGRRERQELRSSKTRRKDECSAVGSVQQCVSLELSNAVAKRPKVTFSFEVTE